jgi:hypothetical protein
MTEVDQESTVVALPAELGSAEELLDGLVDSAVVPRLRGGALGGIVTITLDVVGGTSGTLYLIVARHELADFSRRLLRAIKVKGAGSAKRETSVQIHYGDEERSWFSRRPTPTMLR